MNNLLNIKRASTIKELKQEVLRLQKIGKKVVFTNGCFDLLHIGHIKLFNKAKSLGDALIVAINSDKSLNCIKGSKRPLVNQKDRAKLILSLKPVDYVIIFGEQTPKEILNKIRPDILVKGGDYKLAEIVGRNYVKKVYRVPFVKGKSTTSLINLIVDRYTDKACRSKERLI